MHQPCLKSSELLSRGFCVTRDLFETYFAIPLFAMEDSNHPEPVIGLGLAGPHENISCKEFLTKTKVKDKMTPLDKLVTCEPFKLN